MDARISMSDRDLSRFEVLTKVKFPPPARRRLFVSRRETRLVRNFALAQQATFQLIAVYIHIFCLLA